MTFEPSRKHGPFDGRWPSGLRDPSDGSQAAPHIDAAQVAEALDWAAFSARYFRSSRRHDLEILSAYGAYKHGREWRKSKRPGPPKLRLVVNEPAAEPSPLLPTVAAMQAWEGEGGFIPAQR